MAFKFNLREPLDQDVRRIAVRQIDSICDPDTCADLPKWVHEARKSLKRTRALLRLTRSGMDKDAWRQLNGQLRDAGRQLSVWRDRDVREATLTSLVADAQRPLAAALDRVRRLNGEQNGKRVEAAMPIAADRMATITALGHVRAALLTLEIDADDSTLSLGLSRTHRAARKALQRARTEPGDEAFHDLRKIVQLHWRQMQLLSGAWPDLFAARIAAARALAQCLGREHDLAVLSAWAASAATGNARPADKRLISAACQKRQACLRAEALASAALLFAGRPRTFAREAIGYWSAARSGRQAADVAADTSPDARSAAAGRPRRRSRSAARPSGAGRSTPEGGGGRIAVRGKRGARARAKSPGRKN